MSNHGSRRRFLAPSSRALALAAALLSPLAVAGPAAAAPAPAPAAGAPTAGSAAAVDTADTPTAVLQVNLCSSGADKDCFKPGKSLPATVALVKKQKPRVLAVNEACLNQIDPLVSAMAHANPNSNWNWNFRPIRDASGGKINCSNGHAYGIGVIITVPKSEFKGWGERVGREFTDQVRGSERRAVTCTEAKGHFVACATQLAHDSVKTATAQCTELLGTALPDFAGDSPLPVWAAGTYNLDQKQLDACLASDDAAGFYVSAGDGSQHLVASEDRALGDVESFEVPGASAPALLFEVSEA